MNKKPNCPGGGKGPEANAINSKISQNMWK
jgi:hypothetical protein